MADTISFKLNGKPTRLTVDGDRLLLWVLRIDLGLTGPKFGCGQGHCGCCTVLVDKVAFRSCLMPVSSVMFFTESAGVRSSLMKPEACSHTIVRLLALRRSKTLRWTSLRR